MSSQLKYKFFFQTLRCLASDLLVDHVVSKSGSGSLHLGDPGGDLLDALHLLVKELGLDVVAQVGISVGGLVHVQQALVDSFLEFKSCLESIQRSSPLHGGGLGHVLKDNLASSLVLILDQFLSMLSLLVRRLLEESGKAGVCRVVPVKVGVHGHVDVAGVELHVDLLVDQSLALLLEVLPDAGSHLEMLMFGVLFECLSTLIVA